MAGDSMSEPGYHYCEHYRWWEDNATWHDDFHQLLKHAK